DVVPEKTNAEPTGDLMGREAPVARGAVRLELGNELVERLMTVLHARIRVLQGGVERRRVAVVVRDDRSGMLVLFAQRDRRVRRTCHLGWSSLFAARRECQDAEGCEHK